MIHSRARVRVRVRNFFFQGRQLYILKGDNKHDQYTYYGPYMMFLQGIENATMCLVLGC